MTSDNDDNDSGKWKRSTIVIADLDNDKMVMITITITIRSDDDGDNDDRVLNPLPDVLHRLSKVLRCQRPRLSPTLPPIHESEDNNTVITIAISMMTKRYPPPGPPSRSACMIKHPQGSYIVYPLPSLEVATPEKKSIHWTLPSICKKVRLKNGNLGCS